MKSIVAGLLLSAPLLANAYSIAPDVIDFAPNPIVNPSSPYHYVHNLTDNAGYNTADAITDFTLSLELKNINDGFLDIAYINLGNVSNLWTADSGTALWGNWSYANIVTGANANGLFQLTDGILDVTISSLLGSFELDKSTLTAQAKSTSVPEPTSVALLAAGLLGIAVMRRKSA